MSLKKKSSAMRYLFLALTIALTSSLTAQTLNYVGSWTKINTTYVFDFNLTLHINELNQVQGNFFWQLDQLDEHSAFSKTYYKGKIGETAIEYVQGNYDPATGELTLQGYKKDDPNAIIGIDVYQLEIDKSGYIEGITDAGNTWLGRIKGQKAASYFL